MSERPPTELEARACKRVALALIEMGRRPCSAEVRKAAEQMAGTDLVYLGIDATLVDILSLVRIVLEEQALAELVASAQDLVSTLG